MKKIYTLLYLMVGMSISLSAAHLSPTIQVNARCSGANEVPAVDIDAYGLAVVTVSPDMRSADLIFQASGLSGEITGIHIHEGSSMDNGPVVMDLTPFLNGNWLETKLTNAAGFRITDLISGKYYLNVHTELNPGGEIRGQFRIETDELYGGMLSGDNEVPAVMTDGMGYITANLLYSGTFLNVTAHFDQLSDMITGVHLHSAAAGMNGGVVVDLTPFVVDNSLFATVDASMFAADLRAGNIYINIHTAANPDGELRAQLSPVSGLGFDALLSGAQEVPEVNTTAEGIVNFSFDLDANQINYEGYISPTNTAIIGAHLHTAPAGSNGGVIVDVSSTVTNGLFSGSITSPSTALVNAMLSGGIYLNIHTEEVPSGEIRGQVLRTLREGYLARINGSSQVPSNASEATGVAMLSINRGQDHGHFMMVVDDISDSFAAAHFHDGGAGMNGDVLFDITPFFIDGRAAFGYWTDMGDSAVKIRTTGIYANYHTTDFPDGEIRGDFIRGSATQAIGESDVKSQIFISSNTSGQIGMLLSDYSDDSGLFTFPAKAGDADGIYYENGADRLYQLNRSENVIDVYDHVLEEVLDGGYPQSELSSTSDFSNGREITVQGNILIAAQDANMANMDANRLVTYTLSDNSVDLLKVTDTDINLWGIQLTGNDLWAIVDNSDGLALFENFVNNTEAQVSPTRVITIENMVRTHGLTYDAREDLMLLTDVGEASSAEDGAFVVVSNFSQAMVDGMISADEQVRVGGPLSQLGNPVDIAYDYNQGMIIIAERANGGGKILSYAMPTDNGDMEPLSSIDFSGASAVYFNSTRERGQFVPFDPQYDGRLLFTGRLTGGAEVPAVMTDATGVIGILLSEDMSTATFNMSVNGLSGDITGVHLHEAPAGSNGDVVLNLSDMIVNNQLSMEMTVDSDLLSKLFAGNIYVNVHTEMNPGGELRAQVILEKDLSYVNWITGDQEVPAVTTDAIGLISANLTQVMNQLEVNAYFKGLSSHIIGAHLHMGEAGSNGGVVADLSGMVDGQMIAGSVDASAFVSELRAGNIYLNIHTENNPDGEIRAQLTEWTGITADGWLSGQQSVPEVSTAGLGFMAANVDPLNNVLTVWTLSDNLSADLAAAHLHFGGLGENGGVWVDLASGIVGDDIMFSMTDFDDSGLLDLLSGNIYLNMHTSTFPNGEIRGQALPLTRDSYNYRICTDQENHDVMEGINSNGGGILSLDRKGQNMHLMAVASGLSSDIAGVHIHEGAQGMDGGVIYDLSGNENNGGVFLYGTSTDFNTTVANAVRSGNAYINFHTTTNAAGEIRGQIVKEILCDISSSITFIEESEDILVYPNPFMDQVSFDISKNLIIDNITVYTSTGQQVGSYNVNAGNRVQLGHLESGIYYVLLQTEDNLIREVIVKR